MRRVATDPLRPTMSLAIASPESSRVSATYMDAYKDAYKDTYKELGHSLAREVARECHLYGRI